MLCSLIVSDRKLLTKTNINIVNQTIGICRRWRYSRRYRCRSCSSYQCGRCFRLTWLNRYFLPGIYEVIIIHRWRRETWWCLCKYRTIVSIFFSLLIQYMTSLRIVGNLFACPGGKPPFPACGGGPPCPACGGGPLRPACDGGPLRPAWGGGPLRPLSWPE